MAAAALFNKRRPFRLVSARTVLLAVPSVWITIVLWMVYTAHIVQWKTSVRELEHVQQYHNPETRRPQPHRENLQGKDKVFPKESAVPRVDNGRISNRRAAYPRQQALDSSTRVSGRRVHKPRLRHKDARPVADYVEVVWDNHKPHPRKREIVPGMRFDPPRRGEFGEPVFIDPDFLDPGERAKYDLGWKNHQYNEYASQEISTQRQTPDFRHPECTDINSTEISSLPKASIIICFYNEAWAVLLRTIHSVLTRSPRQLVEEVILVDDFSNMVPMQRPLELYVAQVAKLRLLRMTKRSGLVRARLAGVKEAKGPVLIFLDSHVECANGWLPPLLQTIVQNPRTAVTPEIDVIDHNNFSIQRATDNVGILDFVTFSFDWLSILPRLREKRHSDIDTIESPTMAGGLFAITKKFFLELGMYDTGLELWGGENIELSLKLWMCGGGIQIHPCSRVAHIFREQSPYLTGTKVSVLDKNSARVAEVWAEDYRKFYFKDKPYDEKKYGSLKKQKELKEKLKCRSFSWYVDTIFPEMYIEGTGRYRGRMQSRTGLCIHRAHAGADTPLVLAGCNGAMGWEMSRIHEIRSRGFCMARSPEGMAVVVARCDLQSESQVFEYTKEKNIYHVASNSCLAAASFPGTVEFQSCSGSDLQTWLWADNPDYMTSDPSHREF